MINIVLADDHTLLRDGIQTILSLEDDMKIVGSAASSEEALRLVEELGPDAVLMDIKMPGMNGIACTKHIKERFPETVVIILTTFAEDHYIIEALAAGATGFLLKDMPSQKLTQSIRDAVAGQFILPAVIAAKLAARLASATAAGQLRLDVLQKKSEGILLSEKEKQIALHMLEGKTNRQMAEILFMSEGTIKNYVSSIYAKLGTNDRTIAVMTLRELLQT
ncbi:MAG: two component transcriptional regulator, LuxR family [Paenibacillus sp.]|nr:two component transcriptional regulator, LuxR family [Paenibacillus sp.]